MVRNLNRRTVLAGVGAASGLSLAGCLGEDDPLEEDGARDLRVGVVMPVSGDLAELGGPIRDGAVLPATQLEDADLPFGIDIRDEDTETESDAGISTAQSLVDAGYPAITGAAASDVTIPVAENVFVPNEVVGCSPASTAPGITDLDDDGYMFRTCPSDALQGEVIAELAEDRGYETASTFHLNDDYGQQLSETFVDAFEELGGEVLETVAFEPEEPSYTSALESALGDDPDVMIVVGFPDSGIQIFRDFYADFDADLPVVVTDGLREGGLPSEVDNAMENVFGTAPLADGPSSDAFSEMYEEEYGASPGVFVAQAYDATATLLLANAAAGENSGPAIRDQMREVTDGGGEQVTAENLAEGLELAADGEDVEYLGASSDVIFDDNGDIEAAVYEVFSFEDGEIFTDDELEFEA